MNSKELENRLIDYSVTIIKITDLLPNTRSGNTIANQIVRSGTSPALNYGEAQSAESKNDFIHKIQIVLKELRETSVALKIIKKGKLLMDMNTIEEAINESNELISIFVATINTIKKRSKNDF
jgi:four helix bundle protein